MSRLSPRRALAGLLLAPLPLLAQGTPAAERGGFVVRLGADTMVVERFVRTPDRLEAWSLNRQPATVRRHYVVTMERGVPVRMEYEGGREDGSQPKTRVTMTFGADTTTIVVARPDGEQTMKVAGSGLVPAVGNSFALTELAIARFLAARADSTAVPTLPLGARGVQPLAIRRAGKDLVHVDYFGAPWAVKLDGRGRIVSVDGSASASKISVDRVADVDIDALAREFVARDAAGRGFGIASRPDSVRATVGGASVGVNYSRPARRGRQLLGGIIPFDSVWRTGANAATTLVTSAPLDIGGTTVPAGRYTLWTLPTKGGWQLIVNRQTGQWGTEYHAEQDLARIPMTVRKAADGPELFTLALEPGTGSAATLRMTWGDIDASVPVTVKTP